MGSLYWRNGVLYADYYDRDGIRQRKSTRTADPKVARARLRDLELSTTDRGSDQTEDLSTALDYFTNVACAGKSAGTIRCYKQKARHLSRLLGSTLIDRLSREDIERYIATRLHEGAHRHTVHKELVVLRGALTSAKPRNKFHGSMEIVPEFESGYTPRTTYLTPEQFLDLVEHLVQPAAPKAKPATIARRNERRNRRVLYCILIAFGSPRRGELEALDWAKHVDLGRNILRIPKGKTVSRPIKIHPVLRVWLEGMHAGAGPMVDRWTNVVRDLDWAVTRANAAAAARAAELGRDPPPPMPRVTPNDLRRTFSSWLVQDGVPNMVVSRLLGHSSTRMVDLVYGQLDEATLAAAIGRLPGGDCDAGVSNQVPRGGVAGTVGHGASPLAIVNSVENSFSSTGEFVPRDGVEPPTRGFSVLADSAPKPAASQRLLRVIR